ncbi:hypothetical protein MNBD_GAMMA14-1043 [hydrothermal vent metagenome]|uniref:Transcriptional regulator HTH-type FeoC domain-containing protein n=1 Tax=hydrothermal vent metagenome TaxID=652676 RepID=A0A3B0YB77_9ZZZZ
MILSDIRHYLEARGQATLADIALHFDADPDAVRGMLEVWIRKGRLHRHRATAACGSSCHQCDPAATEIYVWGAGTDATQVTEKAENPSYGSHVAFVRPINCTGERMMRDYGNIPKIDWQDDKPTQVRIKAQLLHEEPLVLQLPDGFQLDLDTQACGCEGGPDMSLGCQPQAVFTALAEANNLPALVEIGEKAEEAGQVVDVDRSGQRLIIHD